MTPSPFFSCRLPFWALPIATLVSGLTWAVGSVHAQTFATTDAWAGASANWSVGPWTNGVPTSGPTNVLEFGNGSLSTGTYTATDNIAGAFQLNGINFTGNPVTSLVTAASGSNTVAFVANGSTSPFVNVSAAASTSPSYGINSAIGSGVNLNLFGSTTAQLLMPAVLSGGGSITIGLTGTVNGTTTSGNSTAFALQGLNTFSGGVTLNADRVAVTTNSTGTPGAVTSGGFGTGTLNWNGGYLRTSMSTAHTVSNAVTIGANANIGLGDNINIANGGATLTLDGATTLAGTNSTATFNLAASATAVAPVAFAGAIGDGGGVNGITVTASGGAGGTVIFSGAAANTYTGLTTVGGFNTAQSTVLVLNKTAGANPTNAIGGSLQINQFGTVRLGAANQIPDGAVVTFGSPTVAGGTFDLAGNNSETVNSVAAASGGIITNSVTGTTGTLTLSNTTAANSGVNTNYYGAIQNGPGAVALVKNGADTLVLGFATITGTATTAASNYSGGTVVNAGGLAIAVTTAIGTGPLTLNGGTIFRGTNTFNGSLGNSLNINGDVTFGLAGASGTTGTTTFTGTTTLGGTANSSRSVTAGGATAATVPVALNGAIGDGGNTIGLTLAAASTSTLVLGGANTYAGPTAVNGGTLLITNNSSAATGAVTVGLASGTIIGTLGGTGTVGGATTVNSRGILAAGTATAPVGTLTFANSLALGGTAAFDTTATSTGGIANKGTTYDLVSVNGALIYGGSLTLNLNGSSPTAGTQYDLFDFGSETGTFSSIAVTNGGSSFGGTFDYTTGILTLTAVPEPSTWMAGVLMLGSACLVYRRNRKTTRQVGT